MLHLFAPDHSSRGVTLLAQKLLEDDPPGPPARPCHKDALRSPLHRHGHAGAADAAGAAAAAAAADLGVAYDRLTVVCLSYNT